MENSYDSKDRNGFDEPYLDEADKVIITGAYNITAAAIPNLVTDNIRELQKLSKDIENAKECAYEAQENARSAKEIEVTWLSGKKEAIEALQEALCSTTEALIESAEIQEQLFDNQKKIGEICKKLLTIGMGNLALNRTMVREISLRLQNASEEELSDLARKELEDLVIQIKAQEDVLSRLDAQKQSIDHLNDQTQKDHETIAAQQKLIQKLEAKTKTKTVFSSAAYNIIMSLIAVSALILGIMKCLD